MFENYSSSVSGIFLRDHWGSFISANTWWHNLISVSIMATDVQVLKQQTINILDSDSIWYHWHFIFTSKVNRFGIVSSSWRKTSPSYYIYWGRVTHICISKLGQHWFRHWPVVFTVLTHYLEQCMLLLICLLGSIFGEIKIKIWQFPSQKFISKFHLQVADNFFSA